MAEEFPKPEELIQIQHRPPKSDWLETPIDIRRGMYCYASNPKSVEYVGLPNARPWNPVEEDWELPENWQEIIHEGFKERLERCLWTSVSDAAPVLINAIILSGPVILKICRCCGPNCCDPFTAMILRGPGKYWAS